MPLADHYDYSDLVALLGEHRQEKIGSNTYAARPTWGATEEDSGEIQVVLHETMIAVLYPDGRVRLNTGGWKTATTADRIRRFLPEPWRLIILAGNWIITNSTTGEEWKFVDGMCLS